MFVELQFLSFFLLNRVLRFDCTSAPLSVRSVSRTGQADRKDKNRFCIIVILEIPKDWPRA